jgi:hypothetical protein
MQIRHILMATILVRSRNHWSQFWKGTTQGPFHQSLVQIGPMVLEELIKMQNANDRRKTDGRQPDDRQTTDGRRTSSGSNSSLDPSRQVS